MRSRNVIVPVPLIFFTAQDSIPATNGLICVLVDASIGQGGILIPLELEDGIIHKVCVEYAEVTKRIKIIYVETCNLLKQLRFELTPSPCRWTCLSVKMDRKLRASGLHNPKFTVSAEFLLSSTAPTLDGTTAPI